MLGAPDYAVVVVYAALILWLGRTAARRSTGLDQYFAAGHALPWWMAAVSHHVSGYSAVVFVGFAGRAATAGLSMWTLFAVPCFIAMMIGALVWAPRWSRLRVLTPVQYLEARYSNTVRMLVALAGIGVKFVDLGIKLYAIAVVVQVCTGWGLLSIISGAGVVTIAYVLVGGLWATVLTDVVQFAVQLVLSVLVVGVVLAQVGGLGALQASLPAERLQLFNPAAGIGVEFWMVYLVVIILSYNGATWGLAQRFISVGASRDTRKAALLSGFLFLLYPLAIFLPAWAGPLLLPEHFVAETLEPRPGFDPQLTYVLVAGKTLSMIGPGLIGLLVCSLFAATMSMIDSDINALAGVFTNDVYRRNWGRNAPDTHVYRVGRAATVVFGAAVLATAIAVAQSEGMEKVFTLTVKLFAAILPPVAIPLMFGMLWQKTTARGAVLSLVGGFAGVLVLYYCYPDSFAIYTGGSMLISFVLYFGEGFFSRRSPEKEQEVERLMLQVGSG